MPCQALVNGGSPDNRAMCRFVSVRSADAARVPFPCRAALAEAAHA